MDPPLPEEGRCKSEKCCEMYDKVERLERLVGGVREEVVHVWRLANKSVQTEVSAGVTRTRDQSTATSPPEEDERNRALSRLQRSPGGKRWSTSDGRPEANGASVLSREKILKLLDQAQINVPLDVSRVVAQKEDYANILNVAQRHRQVVPLEKLLFGDSGC